MYMYRQYINIEMIVLSGVVWREPHALQKFREKRPFSHKSSTASSSYTKASTDTVVVGLQSAFCYGSNIVKNISKGVRILVPVTRALASGAKFVHRVIVENIRILIWR